VSRSIGTKDLQQVLNVLLSFLDGARAFEKCPCLVFEVQGCIEENPINGIEYLEVLGWYELCYSQPKLAGKLDLSSTHISSEGGIAMLRGLWSLFWWLDNKAAHLE
jgi:hypothetical protein